MNHAAPVIAVRRNQRFDLFRILFATLVLLAHAPELTDGNRTRELWSRITGSGDTFGTVAVDGFFLLSGYLIVQSWNKNPEVLNFLRKRILRIVPGYVVAAVVSTVVVGALAPGVPHFFQQLGIPFIKSLLSFSVPGTPPVLPGLPYPSVNGSFWTLAYEFRCYLLVAIFGLLGAVRRPWLWLTATILLLAGAAVPEVTGQMHWHLRNNTFVGGPTEDFHLTGSFFLGGCFLLFRDKIAFRPSLAIAAAAFILLLRLLAASHLEFAVMTAGAYLLFYVAQHPSPLLRNMGKLPDISYGIYLYGYPVESLWIYFVHGSPAVTFLVSFVLSAALGWLSWHFVERPMLQLKKRETAVLPPP